MGWGGVGAGDWLVVLLVVFQEGSWQLRGGRVALTFLLDMGSRAPLLGTFAQPVPTSTGGIPSYSVCREQLQVVCGWVRGSG